MGGAEPWAAFQQRPSPPISSATIARARAFSGTQRKSKSPRLAIAVGAISVAVVTATALQWAYGDSDSNDTGSAARSSSDPAAMYVGPSLDVHASSGEVAPLAPDADIARSDLAGVESGAAQLAGQIEPTASTLAADARLLAREPASSRVPQVTGRRVAPAMPPAPGEAALRLAAAGIDLTPTPEVAGGSDQGGSRLSARVVPPAGGSESFARNDEAAVRSPPGLADEAPLSARAGPNLASLATSPSTAGPDVESSLSASVEAPGNVDDVAWVSERSEQRPDEAGATAEVPFLDTERGEVPALATLEPPVGQALAGEGISRAPEVAPVKGRVQILDEVSPGLAREQGLGRVPDLRMPGEPTAGGAAPAPRADLSRQPDEAVKVADGVPASEFAADLEGSVVWSGAEPFLEAEDGTTVLARAEAASAGSLPLRISSGDLVSVRLADLIALFEDRMDRPLFVWLKSSSSANEYVTFETLRSAGIEAQYDARTNQVALSISDETSP